MSFSKQCGFSFGSNQVIQHLLLEANYDGERVNLLSIHFGNSYLTSFDLSRLSKKSIQIQGFPHLTSGCISREIWRFGIPKIPEFLTQK